MSNIGGITQSVQILTPSYAPLGKPAAGLESPENKDQTLPPVEETSAGDKKRHQPNQKAEAVSDKKEERGSGGRSSTPELTEAEQKQVRELAELDREVRAHEAAHQAAGGALAGAASFRFVTGPDGTRYAVGGEVPISFGAAGEDPEATIRNAQRVRAAALAPAQPSAQDHSVAAEATRTIAQAQLEAVLQRAAALHANDHAGSGDMAVGRAANAGAVDSFQSNAGQAPAPGSLLDQHS